MSWGLQHVSVDVDRTPALIDVDATVEPGAVLAIVGGDGAGKTTLARTLVGLLRAKTGVVRRPESTRIGYLPATAGVWPDLTVTENLAFVADVHRLSRQDRKSRVDHLLAVTELTAAAERLGADLSGGMRRKLGFAMALLAEPELVVLDEPSTGVDPVSRADLWALMTAAAVGGAAVVFTTTYLDEAERARSICALEAGRVLASGTLADIAASVRGEIVDQRSDGSRSWRRGRQWRTWRPDGSIPDGSARIEADLTDLLVAASLAAEEAM